MAREKYGRWMSAFREDGGNSVDPTFDGLASGLASGTISRKRALQLAGAAVLGSTGVLGLFSRRADANTGHFVPCDRETSDFINNFTCNGDECGPAHCETMDCHCVLTRQGGVRCANFAGEHCPATDQCDVNGDCPDNQLCVRVGGCCGHPRRNLCVRRCPEHCPSRGTGGSDFLPPH